MKASESIPNYRPRLREYANFAARTVKKVCTEIGPRESGSKAELDGQNYMAKQVGDAADEVKQEEFKVSPRAFLGWLRIAGILMLVAIAFNIVNIFAASTVLYAPVVTLVFAFFVVLMLVFEFLFYKQLLDPFFPKAVSHNTYCVRKASGEAKRRIVLAGHSDSSIEWRFTHLGGKGLLYTSFAYPAVGLIYFIIISAVQLSKGEINQALIWIGCAFIPGFIGMVIFMNYKICVEGANDNLTGCMTSAAVMKFMGDNNLRFENTELVVMFSGSEEAGLRGAKAAAKLHHKEFTDIETVFVGLDTIKDYDDMAIYSSDMSGLTKHDKRACNLVKKAGENAGLDLHFANLFCGASDAAAMTQAGIPAVCFAAMNPGPPKYYHTRDDKPGIMELKTIEKCVELALETAYLFDEKGLSDNY